jgi:hypothetical protein
MARNVSDHLELSIASSQAGVVAGRVLRLQEQIARD